jgi:hypothetical protein
MPRFVLSAVIGFILTAANACADEPKTNPVSLVDLKYAVMKAGQRGDNVVAIADAVMAFEKALTKFAGKPSETPPELTALRDAVETAAKKGENVEAISKELGLIEKALTGREYERPKPPEPQLELVPPLQRPGRGGIVINNGGGGRVVIGGGLNGRVTVNGASRNFNTTSITIANGEFTIKARKDEINYTVTGDLVGMGKEKIVIQIGEKKIEIEDIKKVPEEHRPAVEELLRMISR